MFRSVMGLVGVVCVAALAFAGGGAAPTGPAIKGKGEKTKADPRVPVGVFERDAKEEQVVRKNGVTFTVRTNAPKMLGDKIIELFWTLRYDGPRSPLVIVNPSIELPSGMQTVVMLYAVPAGKAYAFPYAKFSPLYEMEKPLAAGIGCCLPFAPLPKIKKSKDHFLSVPSGKQVSGSIRIPLKEMKEQFLQAFPGESDGKRAPRLFAEVRYHPNDRAEDLNLDAWTGDLTTGPLLVRGLTEW
jgi:hypothetical protein